MESFYPKFGEVELVLVEDDNDFFDPLESNFECEDDNEDTKLQLNDTIHEENQFNLDIDDIDQDRDASPSPLPPVYDEHSAGFGRKSRIKQEHPDQNCDYGVAATGAANNNSSKFNRPIIAPKFECDVDASEDSLDANNSHFYDNDDDDSCYEDITPIETKPNVDELRLQVKKPSSTQSTNKTTESAMVSIPGNGRKTNETRGSRNANKFTAEKKVNSKKAAKIGDSAAEQGDGKVKNKRKPKAKTKVTTAEVASTATTTAIATAKATATDADVAIDADADASVATDSKDAVAVAVKATTSTKDRSHRKSVKVSILTYN